MVRAIRIGELIHERALAREPASQWWKKNWARKKPWAPVCMGRQYKNQSYIWKILFHIVRLSYTHHTIIIQQIGKCLIL